MCFRPAGAKKAIKCPRCNAFNQGTAKVCRKCGLTEDEAVELMKAQEAGGQTPGKDTGPDK